MNTQTVTAETLAIPFNKLVEDAENVRRTGKDDGIEALADNIAAEGLLQNLIVRKVKGGKFAVVGGERRRRALALLVKRRTMKAADKVPCRLAVGDATGTSLSENIHRLAMHPADQFEAWRRMADDGLSVAEIAKRHGASKKLIEQRLKLGRLSPVLLDALRADEIDVERASAFTVSDDHTRQEVVYETLSKHHHNLTAYSIRRALTEGEVAGDDRLACFVGREAYEAAGGVIRTDLFEETVYFKDAGLLTRLASEKLEAEAGRLRTEGWAWIETDLDQNWRAGARMRRVYPEPVPLTEEEEQEKNRIETRFAEIEGAGDTDSPEVAEEWEALEARYRELDGKEAYRAEDVAIAGGYVSVSYGGDLVFDVGFVRPEDDPQREQEGQGAETTKAQEPSRFSASLRDDLAAIRLKILRAELLKNPKVASDLLAFHTICNVLATYYWASPFQLSACQPHSKRTRSEKGDMGRYAGREAFEQTVAALPMDWHRIECPVKRFEAFRALSEDEKTRLQAYAAAQMLLPQLSDDRGAEPTLERAVEIMETDPASYWRPGAEFFGRMTKSHMLEVAREVIGPNYASRHGKTKKADLAASMAGVFLPPEDMAEAYPKACARIDAWVPDCMARKPDSESDGGLSSPSDA